MYFYLIFVVIILPLAITVAGYFLLKRKRLKFFLSSRQCVEGRGKFFFIKLLYFHPPFIY